MPDYHLRIEAEYEAMESSLSALPVQPLVRDAEAVFANFKAEIKDAM